jgi:NAD(P)-dependent dehydrogenase (short-subunit alcohol dehydrogenase family)
MPSKIILVTGASDGIGRETAKAGAQFTDKRETTAEGHSRFVGLP